MRRVLVVLVVLANVAVAWAQPEPRQRLEAISQVDARYEPRPDAAVNVSIEARQRLFFREAAGDYIRIDAEGVAGPAYIPADSVRSRPLLATPREGVCGCPNDLNSDNRRCGRTSAFCRSGGRAPRCDDQAYETACGRAPAP